MTYAIALLAAILATIANGSAVILEKIGVDQQPRRYNLRNGLLVRLIKNQMYIIGIGLDIVGWLLTLVALKSLPLYLVQSVIAANIIVTALLDQIVLKKALPRRGYRLILLILAALCLLAITAPPQVVSLGLSNDYFWIGVVMVVVVTVLGSFAIKLKGRSSAVALAVVSGIAFGGVSIAARLLVNNVGIVEFFENPLAYVLIIGSIIGTIWFTVALRRSSATLVNAITLSVQTVVPSTLGIVILGDRVRDGFAPVMVIALAVALGGSLALGSIHMRTVKPATRPIKTQ